jgi:hypothetical protein
MNSPSAKRRFAYFLPCLVCLIISAAIVLVAATTISDASWWLTLLQLAVGCLLFVFFASRFVAGIRNWRSCEFFARRHFHGE